MNALLQSIFNITAHTKLKLHDPYSPGKHSVPYSTVAVVPVKQRKKKKKKTKLRDVVNRKRERERDCFLRNVLFSRDTTVCHSKSAHFVPSVSY
jgi:hypothetical protein